MLEDTQIHYRAHYSSFLFAPLFYAQCSFALIPQTKKYSLGILYSALNSNIGFLVNISQFHELMVLFQERMLHNRILHGCHLLLRHLSPRFVMGRMFKLQYIVKGLQRGQRNNLPLIVCTAVKDTSVCEWQTSPASSLILPGSFWFKETKKCIEINTFFF